MFCEDTRSKKKSQGQTSMFFEFFCGQYKTQCNLQAFNIPPGPRAGLNRVARKGGSSWPAWRGGDVRSPRKPAGTEAAHRGLPVKARYPPQHIGPPFCSLN